MSLPSLTSSQKQRYRGGKGKKQRSSKIAVAGLPSGVSRLKLALGNQRLNLAGARRPKEPSFAPASDLVELAGQRWQQKMECMTWEDRLRVLPCLETGTRDTRCVAATRALWAIHPANPTRAPLAIEQ
jgi:hypothetical protein